MSRLLEDLGANQLMIRPFTKLIKTPDQAFWFIGIVMLVVSWFFWPSPATALVGAVLLPVALKVGLPAIGAAVAINLFGHGLALSSDVVIQGAPTITASTAGVDVAELTSAGIPLFAVMAVVTITIAYIMLKRDMKNGIIKVDPEDLEDVIENIKELIGKKPIVGICLGHQLLALTLGGKTSKLKFGHRGGNHPVKDLEQNKVFITSQNHGYYVSEMPENMEVTHINLNDNTVEGMRHTQLPIYSVQYHPEACPGPKDNDYIFDKFLELV